MCCDIIIIVICFDMLPYAVIAYNNMLILQFKSYFAQLLPKQLLLKDDISTSVVRI